MRYNLRLIFVLFLVNLSLTHVTVGQTITDTIYVAADGIDSYVASTSTGTNYGTSTVLNVLWDSRTPATAYRTFIKIDLSAIPTEAIVVSADLKLYASSVYNDVSHPMTVSRVLTSWTETGITWANQPTITSSGSVAITHAQTSSTGWQTFGITGLAQHAINYPSTNYGWRINLNTESGTLRYGVPYKSSESVSDKPYIIVKYVMPVAVDGIVHHCTSGNNGSIEPSISGGSGTYSSYEWFKYDMGTVTSIESGTNMANVDVSGLSDGLYLLTVVDNASRRGYKYFLIGEYGATTTVLFKNNSSTTNSQLFNEDSRPYYNVSTGDGTSVNGSMTSCMAYTTTTAQYSSLIKYQVDIDSMFVVNLADVELISMGHYRQSSPVTTDSGYVSRCTADWQENIVTWNTRPSITTADRITINETNPAGNVTRNDTLDIIPFVQYWQENPDENFGLDLRLKKYGQAGSAYLRYYSYDYATASSRPGFRLSFSLPQPVVTNFIDSLDRGEIVVTAPNGELPYTYMISRDTIPQLIDIWNEIKDSAWIDSTFFFSGKDNAQSYTFSNLESDRYFVAVFDNLGNQILHKQVLLTPETRLFYSSVDIQIDNDTLEVKNGYEGAEGVLLARLPYGDDGGVEMEIVQLADIVKFGFDNSEDAFPTRNSDYNYLVEIKTTGKTYLYRSDTLIDSTIVTVGDKIILTREGGFVNFYKNSVLIGSHAVARWNDKDWKMPIELKGLYGKIKPLVYYGKFKLPKLKFEVIELECGETAGAVALNLPPNAYFGLAPISYIIKNELGSIVASGTSLPGTLTLPIGIYTLYYTYSISGVGYSVYFGQVAVGFPIQWQWDPVTGNISLVPLTVNSITPTIFNVNAQATGINECEATVSNSNWLQFESSGKYGLIYVSGSGYSYAHEDVTLLLNGSTTYARVRIVEYSSGIITRYVALYNGTTLVTSFVSNSTKPFSLVFPTDLTANFDYVKLYQNGVQKGYFATNTSGVITVRAKELGKVLIENTIASFCGENKTQHFADLTKKLDGGYYLARKGKVNFIYKEEYKDMDGKLSFNVYDASNILVYSNSLIPVDNQFGDNRRTLDFSCSGINDLNDGMYVLEVVNEKNEKWYLRFKVINNC